LLAYGPHPPNADNCIAEPDFVGGDEVREGQLADFGYQVRSAEILEQPLSHHSRQTQIRSAGCSHNAVSHDPNVSDRGFEQILPGINQQGIVASPLLSAFASQVPRQPRQGLVAGERWR
jgi:hypothetical protein